MAEVLQNLINVFGIDVQHLIQAPRKVGDVVQRFVEFGDRGAHLFAVFPDHAVRMLQRFVGLIDRFMQLLDERRDLSLAVFTFFKADLTTGRSSPSMP